MVICAVHSCGSQTGRDRLRMFNIPSVISHRCDRTRALSIERRALWLSRINRADLRDKDVTKDHTVCSKHFLKGAPSQLFNNTDPDWAPSLQLGYQKTPKMSHAKVAAAQKHYVRAEVRQESSKRKHTVFYFASSKCAKLGSTPVSATVDTKIRSLKAQEKRQEDASKHIDCSDYIAKQILHGIKYINLNQHMLQLQKN